MIDLAMETEYNVRLTIPDRQDYIDDWAERSEDTRRRLVCRLDVPYGTRAEEVMDVFYPEEGWDVPIHVFIHGGYWQARDKSEFSFIAEPLAARGALVAIVNYALCPAVGLAEIVREVRSAVAWLWVNGRGLGGDPGRIHLSGHSAGGHLVAMMMATAWPEFDPALPEVVVRSGIAISGIFDLKPLIRTSINEAVGIDDGLAARFSPVRLAPTAPGPLLLPVGAQESRSFHAQADRLARRWRSCGLPVSRMTLPGRHHMSAVEALGEPGAALCARALRLMGL